MNTTHALLWYVLVVTHCGLVTPYGGIDLVNIGTGDILYTEFTNYAFEITATWPGANEL